MFNLFGLNVHLYGLLIGIGIWLAFEIAIFRKKNDQDKNIIEDVLWWAVIGGAIGARIYHVVDYWQRYYRHDLIKILYVWEGGLGIWGALAGGMIAIYLCCLRNKQDFVSTLDSLIVGVPLAQAIGRLGNFVNGELYGKNGEPLFAYEAVLNLVLFWIMWSISNKEMRSGTLTGWYLVGYGLIRVLLEGMRSEEIIWKVFGIPTAIIFGLVAVVVGVSLVLTNYFGNVKNLRILRGR